MRTADLATLAAAAALSAATAIAAAPNDDDNDFEGRINKSEETYFGFDLSNNGKKVTGVTAYLRYQCQGKGGSLLIETEGELKVEDGKFSGKTNGESKLDVTYKTEGKLRNDGTAKGTIKATAVFNNTFDCRSPNDGEWRAKEGRDIDVPKT